MLLTGFMMAQISSTSLSFPGFQCFSKKIKAIVCGSKGVKQKPSLFKKIFATKGGLVLTTVASVLAYALYKITPKVYYTFKLHSAYRKKDREAIDEAKDKLDCEPIDNILSGKSVFGMLFGT